MKTLLKELGFEYLPMMTKFIDEVSPLGRYSDKKCLHHICKYRTLISKPLTKGMFISCDEKEDVLFENKIKGYPNTMVERFSEDFEGKEVYTVDNGSWNEYYYTIEQAINNGVELCLK